MPLEVDVLVAVVRVQIPTIGEEVISCVGDGSLVARDLVVVRLTQESTDGDDAVGVGVVKSPVSGQELTPFAPVVLIVREHGEVGALAGMPGKRRSDQTSVVGCES